MAVNVKAFLAIEKSLAARLERSWRQVSSQYVAGLEEAAANKDWNHAAQIVEELDLTPIYDKNSQYIRYASMAALMFGMSRLRSHLKGSNALPGLWSGKLLERGGISLRAQIRGPMTDYLREILLKRLGQLEAEDMLSQQESLQKFDPDQPRAPKGSPIGGRWVKGRFYYEGKRRVMHPISMHTQGESGGEYEKGQAYKWIYDDGEEVPAEEVDRLKKLNVPPAYVNVQLNADIEAPMQAVGTNVKGNVKRFYYSWFHEKNAAEKFSRVQEFDADLDGIRRQILKDLHSPDEKVRAAAEVLYLIDQTGFRVGGDGDTKADKQAFGASTLLASHVRVTGTKVAFSFPSKNGMRTTKTVDNQILADLIERRRAALGNTRGKPLLPGTDDDAREYLKAITGKPYLVKDFRTWHATSEALGYMQKWKTKPRTEKEMKKRRREVVKHVANFIGDTPNMALKYYIDPSVWEWWEPQRDETDDA